MAGEYSRASKTARKKRPSAEVRAQEEFDQTYLRLHGWWVSDCGWRHRTLRYPWPLIDAKRVTEEAEAGMMDAAHRSLRGEG